MRPTCCPRSSRRFSALAVALLLSCLTTLHIAAAWSLFAAVEGQGQTAIESSARETDAVWGGPGSQQRRQLGDATLTSGFDYCSFTYQAGTSCQTCSPSADASNVCKSIDGTTFDDYGYMLPGSSLSVCPFYGSTYNTAFGATMCPGVGYMGSLYTAPGAQLSAVDLQAFEDSQVRGAGAGGGG
jgi:hypothetical protein